MKAILIEHEGCFEIDMEAETMEDTVKIARFGILKLKELRGAYASFPKDGIASASLVIGKSKHKVGSL